MQVTETRSLSACGIHTGAFGLPSCGRSGDFRTRAAICAISRSGVYCDLLEERIGQNAVGHIEAGELSADHNHRQMRKALPDHGKKLKPIHVRHLQVGDNQIGKRILQRGQSIEAVFGAQHFIAMRFQDRLGQVSQPLVIVHEKDPVLERHDRHSPRVRSQQYGMSGAAGAN